VLLLKIGTCAFVATAALNATAIKQVCKKNLGNIQIKVWDYDGYSSASFIYEALGKIIFVKDYSKLTF